MKKEGKRGGEEEKGEEKKGFGKEEQKGWMQKKKGERGDKKDEILPSRWKVGEEKRR